MDQKIDLLQYGSSIKGKCDTSAEEGVRILGEGKFLVSDSFLGNERTTYRPTSKIPLGVGEFPILFTTPYLLNNGGWASLVVCTK